MRTPSLLIEIPVSQKQKHRNELPVNVQYILMLKLQCDPGNVSMPMSDSLAAEALQQGDSLRLQTVYTMLGEHCKIKQYVTHRLMSYRTLYNSNKGIP